MKPLTIALLTGIYPPDIGGPATYAKNFGRELSALGHRVIVITYGEEDSTFEEDGFTVHRVAKSGWVWQRYRWYRQAIDRYAGEADLLYSFGTVSVGVPLMRTSATGKKLLRLGGDFIWERYSDLGGKLSLLRWYRSRNPLWRLLQRCNRWLLSQYDWIIFSTEYQQSMYLERYGSLPTHSIIHNALQPQINSSSSTPTRSETQNRLLFIGRFVKFKNLPSLLRALVQLPAYTLTIAGDGPERTTIECLIRTLQLDDRVTLMGKVGLEEKLALYKDHDVFVLPSYCDISPNAALEARANGMTVLLPAEHGLGDLAKDCSQAVMDAPGDIVRAINNLTINTSAVTIEPRTWEMLTKEHLQVFEHLSN